MKESVFLSSDDLMSELSIRASFIGWPITGSGISCEVSAVNSDTVSFL
jgi:hypothetical protein